MLAKIDCRRPLPLLQRSDYCTGDSGSKAWFAANIVPRSGSPLEAFESGSNSDMVALGSRCCSFVAETLAVFEGSNRFVDAV